MRFIKRFCCGCSIATGVQVIGYFNFVQIIFILVISNLSGLFYGNISLLFPIIDLIVFFKMMRYDSVGLRLKFFRW